MKNKGRKLKTLNKVGKKYKYKNQLWTLNKPKKSTAKGKKMMVLASKNVNGEKRVKLVHFGALNSLNYYHPQEHGYFTRATLRKSPSKLIKKDPFSAAYWSRKILWPANKRPIHSRKSR